MPTPPFLTSELSDGGGLFLLRLLVLDLDAATRKLLVEAIATRGHEVTEATSLEAAATQLTRGGFDAVIVKVRQAWAEPLKILLENIASGAFHPVIPEVLAVMLDDPPAHPAEWLAWGVDDCATGLERDGQFALRLAALEKRLMARRRRQEAEWNVIYNAKNYENLFRFSPSAVLIVTENDGLVLEANEAAVRELGLPVADLRDKFISLLLPGLANYFGLTEAWEGRGPWQLPEFSHERPDGQTPLFAVEVARCFWSSRPALWLRLENVTGARLTAAEEIRHARQDAVRIVTSGTAQALNDMLTAIRGNLDLLSKANAARASIHELLDHATAACSRAEDLLRTLGGLAKTSFPSARTQRQDLSTWLPRVVSFAALNANLQVSYQLAADLWPVEVDEVTLKEAVLALVENAGLAQPQGGELHISAANEPASLRQRATVEILFHNPGETIASANLQRVFDPFFSTWPGRQGLGLARVQAIITAHGGHVDITSAPSRGTTVRVALPAAETPVSRHPAANTPPPPPTSPPKRVLVMDDDASIRVIVEKMLTLQGFDVYTVRDGQEAITAYRRALELGSPFDVVLLDLEVRGGMGGRECIARLRGEFRNVKALLSTGALDDTILENHREHGFSGVVTKPFNIERLVNAVKLLADI